MSKAKGKNWYQIHTNDPYVKQSQRDNYRSRASYKLLEIHNKDKLFRAGQNIVDLGASPGGWSQVAAEFITTSGTVFAIDILPMTPIAGVKFIQGDFSEEKSTIKLLNEINKTPIDLVISDIAPNLTGNESCDQANAGYLCELVIDFTYRVLKNDGTLVMKVFQGAEFNNIHKTLKHCFKRVCVRKPKASRPRSREVYLVCKNFLKNETKICNLG